MLKNFKFSPILTIFSILLALLMFKASHWQFRRYKEKITLVDNYKLHSRSLPETLPLSKISTEDLLAKETVKKLKYKKIELPGEFNFEKQVAIKNKRHKNYGPGFMLLTPFKIAQSDIHILVSRGFIPYAENKKDEWKKFNFPEQKIEAVLKPTVPHRTVIGPRANTGKGMGKDSLLFWNYPDIEKISALYDIKILKNVYLEKLGNPPKGDFPAEQVTFRLAPRVHLGYTVEWAVLALITLLASGAIQAGLFRRKNKSA